MKKYERYIKTPLMINTPWKNKRLNYMYGSPISYISDTIERAVQETRLKCEETEKEFIFSNIKAFVDTTSTIEISKDELFEAIRLVEKRNYALKKYGVDIFAVDNTNMAAIMYSLDSAYDLGVDDGYKKARQEVVDFITKGGH